MSYLVGRHHLSRRGVREYLEDALGVPVSLGTVGVQAIAAHRNGEPVPKLLG
jgi:hypothetical protein